ncbi:hypothetical protein BT69DRAFT_1314892 [Atractiella rhizophila]|nr:hypothetical protein BT69DRAFT_1314892 [Atractiella rhizophila]
MTSVPKPLKFLRPHYPSLQSVYNSWPSSSTPVPNADKNLLADILSVLAMTYSDEGRRETLKYRLKGGSDEDPGVWGHEYVRHLAAEIGEEYVSRQQERASQEEGSGEEERDVSTQDLLELSKRLLPFLLSHNAESDACDLLLELETIGTIIPFVTEDTFARVGLYLISCVNYLPPPEDAEVMKTAREIYRKHDRFMEALVLSIRLGDRSLVEEDFESPKSSTMKRQLAYVLARHGVPLTSNDEKVGEILNNAKLAEDFKAFAKELNVVDAKVPEDVYKSHLENSRTTTKVDSALQNLADTFVNAFVNAGFGNDKLMVEAPEGQSWIYKNKDAGMMAAAASLGLLCLWDVDVGMGYIDNYTYVEDDNIKVISPYSLASH